MKFSICNILLSTVIVILFSDCSVQKRHYRKGYHVEWFAEKSNPAVKKKTQASVVASKVIDKSLITERRQIESTVASALQFSAVEKIKVATSAVSTIKQKHTSPQKQKMSSSISCLVTVTKKQHPQAADLFDEKSQIIALILCLVVGVLGVHRFYLGYIGIGIIQILTLGGCGIWTLIDLVMIITGDLQPKDGEYDETF